ncbi:hypothetical protein [Flavobacterium sp. AED]|jgi:hypothetical protein|uniref:hypothetical protein n=1 Tax=Flavobacterium sp. AED TaxID=1423323 RepID=UPI0005800B82|nr:hypothetical protein [Flavobacterium sp. AED]KIA85498.1 hypothetical protein OA85_09375 [Flavobacterium sp. AED]
MVHLRKLVVTLAKIFWSIMPAISFKPTSQTVIRFNYRFQEQRDTFGNPPAATDGMSFGLSTYF